MKFWKKKFAKIRLPKHPDKKLIFALLVILVGVFLLTRSSQGPNQAQTTTVQTKTITSEISASGSTKSQTSSTLKFSTYGKIAWIGVEEGDYVKRGQAIASLEKEPLLVALRQVEQDVNSTDAILSQVYDEQKKQTAAENFDQKIRRTNAETAKNKAYDSMRKAEFDLARSTIYSPQAGIITNLEFIAGEEVSPSSEIAQVHDLTSLKFVAEVDETDIAKVQVGQSVKITLDAYPDQTIDTSIGEILPVAITTETGATVYEATAIIPGNNTFYIGMNGQAQIIVEEKTNALVIPADAITDDKYVLVKVGSTYVQKEIRTGLESDTQVEVTGGLSEGEEIVISGPATIQKPGLILRVFTR